MAGGGGGSGSVPVGVKRVGLDVREGEGGVENTLA